MSLVLSLVQCAGVNGDNYLGAFSEPVAITVEPPETREGIDNTVHVRVGMFT